MENLSIVLGVGLIFTVAYLFKLKQDNVRLKKHHEQMLFCFKDVLENVSVIEYVALQDFIKLQSEKEKSTWKNLYNYLFA